MLCELRVENLLLLERAELRLAPGLNVLTGETGAGKTLLAHALDLLLGGRARTGVVRAGSAEASVEGVFELPEAWSEEGARASAENLIPDGAEELVLARRVWPDGRTRAYVCGRSATMADLRELGGELLSFYGQHEHRKLMLSTAQLDVLDTHCGAEQLGRRAAMAREYERVRGLQQRVRELSELAGARERELDLLAFELEEIEAAAPNEAEFDELEEERGRLRHVETLRAAAAAAVDALSPEAGAGVGELLATAARGLEGAAAIDPELAGASQRAAALIYEARDLAGELRGYLLGMDATPGRLEEVEERLGVLARLQRKHGGTIADVLAHAERCRARRDELQGAEVALEDARVELERAQTSLDELAGELSRRRRVAAPELAQAVRERLAELAMPDAEFTIELSPRADGCGPRGADNVALLIAPNAGVPAAPLREIASGGELSRVMLALLSVAHGGGPGTGRSGRDDRRAGSDRGRRGSAPACRGTGGPLLVFDEIDAGIGGLTARAVGAQLRELARGRQVLCITHLPQVAALGTRHFTIAKDNTTSPARTTVTALQGDAVVGELVRMLGGGQGDRAVSQHARQLLRAA
jgi:DNA repair protein RecN (Recombination protein N)